MRANNDTPSWRALPSKEQSVFKHMMWLYEQKHNKKAIKQADLILKKFPEHGETLSMKGLILSNMGAEKKQEAYDYAKRGLKADITNCVCWHVLGLLYRQDKDYAEASKCFIQTLRLDPNNYPAMRDLANLQIHERNLDGFLETRRHILKARSRFIREWAAFAMANHLVGRLTIAQEILGEMENQFGESRDLDAFEKSEIMLYKAAILEEMGEYKQCYDYLTTREQAILDETALLEAQGRMAIFLRQFDLGRVAYRRLMEINKDNERYVLGFMACDENEDIRNLFALPKCCLSGAVGKADSLDYLKLKQLQDGRIFAPVSSAPPYIYLMPGALRSSGEDSGGWLESAFTRQAAREAQVQQQELQLLKGWKSSGHTEAAPPSFRMVRGLSAEMQDRILSYFDDLKVQLSPFPLLDYLKLSFLSGGRFVAALDDFLRPQLRKGVVSLFAALRRLYTRERAHLIGTVLESYVEHLQRSPSSFGPLLGERREKRQDEPHCSNTSDSSNACCGNSKNSEGLIQNNSLNCSQESGEKPEIATALLYAYMLMAQHYDFMGNTEKALQTIQKAIDHTPTFADLYLVKGRIYKHAGAYRLAAELHEKARSLDFADRYLNSKCCSYLLRINKAEEAVATARCFSRQADPEDSPDLQCMWFELKRGRALVRLQQHQQALMEFNATIKHFADIHQDQVDFHPYCLRKSTFRAYVNFLRMQDKLWSHRYFREAAQEALKIYFAAHDGLIELKPEAAARPAAEPQKEAKAKKKQANKKASKDQKAATNSETQPEEAPLAAAQNILDKYICCCATDPLARAAHYHLAYRKGCVVGMVLALSRLNKLIKREGTSRSVSVLLPLLYHFCRAADLSLIPSEMEALCISALSAILETPLSPSGLQQQLQQAADKLMGDLLLQCKTDALDFQLRKTALEAYLLAGEDVPDDSPLLSFPTLTAAAAATSAAASGERERPSLADCEALLQQLQQFKGKEKACEALKAACRLRFPLSDLFNNSD
ncbi:N-terminal acetyltransferase complex subunit NARG1, putative [Eimeria necatrix]|uniref:N-terminal acetyltransferase complex subunit NARG1, putative n=1 Tax=Eimeria necatrix TaxID=51315 RepID=U6MM21_9EIME|nr:N-terminal acetyltransferase complex subunit NARG1, putative [Eimeria necatrix]CDJ65297.1 N-terminal acetyltransferase complex subunit NARG1, putative [Eimeria necatrix]